MVRALLISLVLLPVLALSQVTWTKDMPPTHPPLPSARTMLWDLDGTHAVEFTWEYGQERGMETYSFDSCDNICQGKKHLLHEQCDSSCDAACEHIHSRLLEPELYLADSEFVESPNRFDHVFEREAGKVGVGPKYPWNQVAWGMVQQIRGPVEKDAKYRVQVNWRHYNKEPCSTTIRCHVAYKVPVTLVWEIFRYDQGPDGRQVKVSGGKHRTDLGHFVMPQDGVAVEVHRVRCYCSIVIDEEPVTPQTDPQAPPQPPVEDKRTGAVIRETDSGTAVCDSKVLREFNFGVVCENMNECTVSCSNPTDIEQKFKLLPGLVLIPGTEAYQRMMLTTPISLTVPPRSTVSQTLQIVRAGPMLFDLPQASGKGRLLCMNIELKEPNAGVPYRIGGRASSGLSRLAQITYGSSIRGTHDQVRLWIATDAASLEKIQSILFPKPGEGMYADCLFDAFHYAELSNVDPQYEKCFVPSLLVGAAKARTAPWLVEELTRRNPGALAKWVSGNLTAFAPLFSEAGSRLGVPHAARVAVALCHSSDPKVRMSGLELVSKGVPEATRKEFAAAGGLTGAATCLMTGPADEAKAALAALELYGPDAPIWGLRNVSAQASDEVKARAAELAKKLSGQ